MVSIFGFSFPLNLYLQVLEEKGHGGQSSGSCHPSCGSVQRLERRLLGVGKRAVDGETGDQGLVLLVSFVAQDLLASVHLLWASSHLLVKGEVSLEVDLLSCLLPG